MIEPSPILSRLRADKGVLP